MTGKPTNRMEIDWLEDGSLSVEYVDLNPGEYAAQPTPPEPTPRGFDLGLSVEARKDPILSTMASECAIYGLSRRAGHIWGE